MRSASFKPKQDKARKGKGIKSWYVSSTDKLSPTGKRQRLFFETFEEALQEHRRLKKKQEAFGDTLANLSRIDMIEAAEIKKELEQAGIRTRPLAIIRQHIEDQKKRNHSLELGQLFEQYLDVRKEILSKVVYRK